MTNEESAGDSQKVAPRKLGQFKISRHVLHNWPLLTKTVMRDVVVVDVKHHYDTGDATFMAYCDAFEEIEPGIEAPFYECKVTRSLTADGQEQFKCDWVPQRPEVTL